jgi:hypothetical protein
MVCWGFLCVKDLTVVDDGGWGELSSKGQGLVLYLQIEIYLQVRFIGEQANVHVITVLFPKIYSGVSIYILRAGVPE